MLPAPTACAVVAIMSSRDVKIASRPRLGLVAAEGARPAAVAIREAVDARAAIEISVLGCARDVAPLLFILPVVLTPVDTLQAS